MSDENDRSKKDDREITVPHLRLGKEKNANNFSDDSAPPLKSAKQWQMDDWEMVPPDLNKPNSQQFSSDFDKITPNTNTPKDVRQDKTPLTLNQPPTEDLGMTIHNISISREEKLADWEVTIPSVNNPKQNKKDGWSMPEPIFRISEGESLEEVAKRASVFNLKDVEDFGKTAPDFNSSVVLPPEPFNQTAPSLNLQPKPNMSDSFSASEIAVENKPPVRQNNYNVIFIVVGLFSMLFLASVVLFGIYLLFLKNP